MPHNEKEPREEIRKIVSEEIEAVIDNLCKNNVMLKEELSDHKRRIESIERDLRQLLDEAEARCKETENAVEEDRIVY